MLVKEIFKDNEDNSCYRILWLDAYRDIAYVLNLIRINTLPIKSSYKLLSEQFENGDLKTMSEQFSYRYLREDEIKENNKNIRDKAWNIICDICTMEPEIYDGRTRGKIIAACAKKHNVTRMTVTRHLYRYWQRGCVRHALLPDYNKCGASGKIRATNPGIKRGRPRINRYDNDIGRGINVDKETREIFIKAYKKFYEKSRKYPIEYAYIRMLEKYYPDSKISSNGNKYPYLFNKPTKQQFYYWIKKTYNPATLKRLREGEKNYNLNYRAVMKDSSAEATRPGEKFQIDASIFDCYLVACFDRNAVIGFPVVYSVKDVFSRQFVGLYVGIENPSYLGLGMAIYNTARSKKEFCKEYGVDINTSDWPCAVLPTTLFADNGTEHVCRNSDQITSMLGVSIENAPTGRGDLKPIVESSFNQLKEKVMPLVPGYVPDYGKRQGDKYKYDATLTIKEFTAILISLVLNYNNSTWLKDYPLDEDMIREGVKPIPLELWNWGVKNRVGYLKQPDINMVKLACMYSDNAKVTEKGIRFNNRYYLCDRALKENWFASARIRGYWDIDIAYDPRNLEKIYLKEEEGFEICTVTSKGSNKAFENWVLEEVEYFNKLKKIENEKLNSIQYESQIKFIRESDKIINNAKSEKKKVNKFDMRTKKEKRAIKPNKDIEKNRLREEQKFDISRNKEIVNNKPLIKDSDDLNISYFMKKQQERLLRETGEIED